MSTSTLEDQAAHLAFAQFSKYSSIFDRAPQVAPPKGRARSRTDAGAESAFVVNGVPC